MMRETLAVPAYLQGAEPEILEYYERVCKRRELKPGEIALRFNGFLDLPIQFLYLFTGFMQCPVGLALTERRLWVAHLDFEEGTEEEMWINWGKLETKVPVEVFALGINKYRLESVIRTIQTITSCTAVNSKLLTSQKSGLFNLSIAPENQRILCKFEEEGVYTNNISFVLGDLQTTPALF